MRVMEGGGLLEVLEAMGDGQYKRRLYICEEFRDSYPGSEVEESG